jgi:hypothetical protein
MYALAAWRCGHPIKLKNRRPGLESTHGGEIFEKHISAVVKVDLLCIVCVIYNKKYCLWPQNYVLKDNVM